MCATNGISASTRAESNRSGHGGWADAITSSGGSLRLDRGERWERDELSAQRPLAVRVTTSGRLVGGAERGLAHDRAAAALGGAGRSLE